MMRSVLLADMSVDGELVFMLGVLCGIDVFGLYLKVFHLFIFGVHLF